MEAFDNLSNLLSEMQDELAMRRWSDDVFDRIGPAMDFRGKLFEAILDFAREQYSSKVPA